MEGLKVGNNIMKNDNCGSSGINYPKFIGAGTTGPDGAGIGGCDRTTYVKTEEASYIKDSGQRRQFETGAVRDIQEGKGRFDLMPLDIVGEIIGDYRLMPEIFENSSYAGRVKEIYSCIESFKTMRYDLNLKNAICSAAALFYAGNIEQLFLDVAIHFEEGAKKYGENNWKKGLPIECYIDSGARHLTKHLAGMTDEPHLRAFIWNMLCCIWTNRHIGTPTEG